MTSSMLLGSRSNRQSQRLVDVAKTSAMQTLISVPTDLGLVVDYEVGEGESAWLELECPWLTGSATTVLPLLYFTDLANTILMNGAAPQLGASLVVGGSLIHEITVPGLYTTKARLGKAGAGTVGNNTNAGVLPVSTLRAFVGPAL